MVSELRFRLYLNAFRVSPESTLETDLRAFALFEKTSTYLGLHRSDKLKQIVKQCLS